jgi:hypothetical protein
MVPFRRIRPENIKNRIYSVLGTEKANKANKNYCPALIVLKRRGS